MRNEGAIVAALAKLAAAFGRTLDRDMVAVWSEALDGCDDAILGLAIRRVIAEEPRFPVPAVVLGYYGVVEHEQNLTDSELRRLRDDQPSRSAQEHTNRRGRRLLREVSLLLHGADIFGLLPGDDQPLSDQDLAAVNAEAKAIVQANAR